MMTYKTPSQTVCKLGVRTGNPNTLSPAITSLMPFLCKKAISPIESEILQMHCIQMNLSCWQALQ